MKSDRRQYDMVLRGGRVICPATGVDAVTDVAVRDGKIHRWADTAPAALGPGLAVGDPVEVLLAHRAGIVSAPAASSTADIASAAAG